MEQQRDNREPHFFRAHFQQEREHSFLNFTRQLSQFRNAEPLLQALPSTLNSFIRANSYAVALAGNSHLAQNFSRCSENGNDFIPLDLSTGRPSVCAWVYENQNPLIVPSILSDTRFSDTATWFGSDKSLCILPLSTTLRRLGVICVGRSSENAFPEQDVSLLTLAADHAALALDSRLNLAASEKVHLQLQKARLVWKDRAN